MEGILTTAFLVSLLAASVRMATPILLAALGDIFTQRSGILNLGLEGMMLLGAFGGFWGAHATGSLWAGVGVAVLFGALAGFLFGVVVIHLRANQIVAGLAFTIFGAGLSTFLFRAVFGIRKFPPRVDTIPALKIAGLSDLPFVGPVLFQHNLLVYVMLVLVVVAAIGLDRTHFGLKVRAVGENPQAADAKGVSVPRIRYICTTLGGAGAGLGGAFLSLAFLGTYLDKMTAGRGFIAIAVVLFSKWRPWGALGAALLFGGADALQLRLQGMQTAVPYQVFQVLPYVLTIAAMVGVSRRAEFPAAFTLPYRREEG
ncbi:MAG: ABC transporter permease [Nitrospinota bacterium]